MPQKVIGIDVGTYSIKISEIEQTYKKFELVRFHEKLVHYNEVLSPEEAQAATLQSLIEEKSISGDVVLTALPGEYSATRVLEFPFTNPKKIDAAVEFEIESYVPFKVEDMIIDYHVLGTTQQSSSVLISYAKKTDFIKFLSIFSGVSLDPGFVGCEAIELGNLLRLGLPRPDGAYALVNIGHKKTEVAIFKGSSLKFTRTILTGGKDITERIASELGVPFDEAEKMKIDVAQLGEDPASLDELGKKIALAAREVLAGLIIDLKQTFSTFQEKVSDEVVQALYILGGSARLPGVDQYFSFKLRKNVSLLDPMDYSFNQLKDSSQVRSIIATSLSIASRSTISGKLPDIQFRRGEFAYRGDLKGLTKIVKQVGVLAACLLIFAVLNFTISYSLMKSRVQGVRKDAATIVKQALPEATKSMIQRPKRALSEMNSQVLDLRDKKRRILEMTDLKLLEVFREISEVIPSKENLILDVDTLTYASNHIVLKGQTGSFKDIDLLKEAFEKSKFFSKISTGNAQQGKGNFVKFKMTLEIKTSEEVSHGA